MLALLGFGPADRGQSTDLDALAQEVAAAIESNTKDLDGIAQVWVSDFRVSNHGPSVPPFVGSNLADIFDTALRKGDHHFTVLERDESLSAKATASGDDSICRKGLLEANVMVTGGAEVRPGGGLSLSIRAIQDKQTIFAKSVVVSPGPEIWRSKTELSTEPFAWPPEIQGKVPWVRSRGDDAEAEKPIRLAKETEQFTLPRCIRCPNAQFPDAAVKARVQGTLLMDVEISAKGLPMAIGVVKWLPCGLTTKAVKETRDWKFAPATGPDGKPIAVLSPIETTFRLY